MRAAPASEGSVRMPPPLDLRDPGLVWRDEGGRFVLARRGTVRGAFAPAALALLFGAFGASSWIAGAVGSALLNFAIVALSLAVLALKAGLRVAYEMDAGGVRWRKNVGRRGTPREGVWSREAIEALRLRSWDHRTRLGSARVFSVDLRVDGTWVDVVSGRHEKNARAVAGAMSRALRIPIEEASVAPDEDS